MVSEGYGIFIEPWENCDNGLILGELVSLYYIFLSCSVSMEKVGLLLSSGWRSLWNWTSLLVSEVMLGVKFSRNCHSSILLGCVTWAAWFFLIDCWFFCFENMQTFEGNKLICINRKMECSMCKSQLKMIFLFYVSAGRRPLSTF